MRLDGEAKIMGRGPERVVFDVFFGELGRERRALRIGVRDIFELLLLRAQPALVQLTRLRLLERRLRVQGEISPTLAVRHLPARRPPLSRQRR